MTITVLSSASFTIATVSVFFFAQAIYILNDFGQVYFDTKECTEQVIEEFKDELIWYFTEFKSRMD